MIPPDSKYQKVVCSFNLSRGSVEALRNAASGNLRSASAELDLLLQQVYDVPQDADSASVADSWQNSSNATALPAKTGA